jgi:hypothetical protein
MNERPWPAYPQVSPISGATAGNAGIQQVAAALNALIAQFNQQATTLGGLGQQIVWMREALVALQELQSTMGADITQLAADLVEVAGLIPEVPLPFTGANDDGYITNEALQSWPAADWIVGFSEVPALTVHSSEKEPYVEVSASAGPLYVSNGAVYLDQASNFGIAILEGNLQLGAVGGAVVTAGVLNASGGFASGLNVGASVTTGGLTFVNGLYTEGESTGGVVDPVDDGLFYLRYHEPAVEDAVWYSLATFLPGLVVDTAWAGSASLTTLGTVGTGTWEADPIADDFIASAATWTAKQDALGAGEEGDYLANGPAWANLADALTEAMDDYIPKGIGLVSGDLITFSAEATPVAFSPGGAAGFLRWSASTWAVALVGLPQMAAIAGGQRPNACRAKLRSKHRRQVGVDGLDVDRYAGGGNNMRQHHISGHDSSDGFPGCAIAAGF